ncbi:MAG: efflux RND transporter periplasmic adaptor subunit [Alistipes sp.]|jgi:RND family efflux transporter MFP subunit|nr:efflux RND transporter periplasmic adaptor subunit [Alistipes sp.]
MKKNRIFTLGVMTALAVLSLAGCKQKNSDAQTAAELPALPTVSVKTAVATAQTIARDVEFTAGIEPWQKNFIVPALQGARIEKINVKVGDRVRRGQLVVEMDPMQYNTARVQAETAEADYNRVKMVYEAGGVSEQTLRQAEAGYLVAKEMVDNLARNVKLYSPIDGVVTQRGEEPGNLFTQTPILEIMQIDRLKVRIAISEQYFASVNVGTPVSIAVDILPGETFEGKVSLVYPAIDPATRTFTVEVTIPNAGGRLRPGMFARSTINMGDTEGVMVPDVAVQKQVGSNERFVYVISEGVAHRRSVTPGRQIGSAIDVAGSVAAGETVAVTSFSRLGEGAPVVISD